MKLEIIQTYRLDGKEFSSLAAAQMHVINEVGKIIDSTPLRLKPHDALKVHEAIMTNRGRLVELLTVTFETDDEKTENLLDLNH